MGPLFIDLESTQLDGEERELLDHPLVGGVILFSRNFEHPKQLRELNASIRKAASQPVLIAVDHEGGRVQRFREGFTQIPAMGELNALAKTSGQDPLELCHDLAWLMACELRCCDVDLSFAPVLDVNGLSEVIGTRAFARDPDMVIKLARSWCLGMRQAGMKTTAKHFPGHGSVVADSHIDSPVDNRSWSDIEAGDLRPFATLVHENLIDAVMPAHVIYSQCCSDPAGFSQFWLQKILRHQLAFQGVIFSDDLSMQAAHQAGDALDRALAALSAGCDMLLACNDRASTVTIIDGLPVSSCKRGEQMFPKRTGITWRELEANPLRMAMHKLLAQIEPT